MNRNTVTFRGNVYCHQQMEGLIRALTRAGYGVRQYSTADGTHDCSLHFRGLAVPQTMAALSEKSRWKALAQAVRTLEQP